jgi:hypothetical protein
MESLSLGEKRSISDVRFRTGFHRQRPAKVAFRLIPTALRAAVLGLPQVRMSLFHRRAFPGSGNKIKKHACWRSGTTDLSVNIIEIA